jgi:protein-tyrosine phosphatase
MKHILFVCTANIARSPMAEVLFRHKIAERELSDQFETSSAGTWARDGVPAPQDGQAAMAARGLDTSLHRSRVVSTEIMTKADLILTMEQGHKEALRIEFPAKKSKIFLLTEMISPGYDVDDPYRRGAEKFDETAAEIDRIISQGLDKIITLANS